MTSKKMKLGMSAILLVFVSALACAADRGGTLTITGIPAGLNGHYIAFFPGWPDEFFGVESVNVNTGEMTLVRISGGRAIIPIWINRDNPERVERFSPNFPVREVEVVIVGMRVVDMTDLDMFGMWHMFNSITFTNGNATTYWGLGRRVD